jgi:hypothetical protein
LLSAAIALAPFKKNNAIVPNTAANLVGRILSKPPQFVDWFSVSFPSLRIRAEHILTPAVCQVAPRARAHPDTTTVGAASRRDFGSASLSGRPDTSVGAPTTCMIQSGGSIKMRWCAIQCEFGIVVMDSAIYTSAAAAHPALCIFGK